MNSIQRRVPNLLLSGGMAFGFVAMAQPGCMPDLNGLSSDWHPASGASGKPASGGTGGTGGTGGSGGKPPTAGNMNGGSSNSGSPSGGRPSGGKGGGSGKGGTGAHPNGGKGGTGAVNSSGGDAGVDNGEGGAAGVGAMGGEGGAMCYPGYTTCPGGDVCGTALEVGEENGSTFDNCGACGVTCSVTNASSATCTSGACKPSCETGFGDCNSASTNDGCEADLTRPATCGSCTHACSGSGVTTPGCSGGVCAPTCAAKWGDCILDTGTAADDGCETYLDALSACGTSCGTRVVCSPTDVCNSGTCGAAAGLAVMSIPFTATGQGQRYGDKFTTLLDLTGATVTLRMYAPNATNGYVNVYITDASFGQGATTTTQFTALSAGWTDIVVSATGAIDPANSYQVTIEFYSNGTGPWANPTVVYLDGVWSSNQRWLDTFDTTKGNMVTSSLLVVTGSTLDWTAAVP